MAPSQQVNWEAMCTSASFSRHVHSNKMMYSEPVRSCCIYFLTYNGIRDDGKLGFITCLLANGNQREWTCIHVWVWDHHVGFVKWWIEKFIYIQREKIESVCNLHISFSSLLLPESGLEYILPRSIHLWSSMVMCVCIVSSPACPLPDSTTAPLSLDIFPGAPLPLPPLCMPPVGPSSPQLQLFASMPFFPM